MYILYHELNKSLPVLSQISHILLADSVILDEGLREEPLDGAPGYGMEL